MKSPFLVLLGACSVAAMIGCAMGSDEEGTIMRNSGQGGSEEGGSGGDAGAQGGSSGDGGPSAGGSSGAAGKGGTDGGAGASGGSSGGSAGASGSGGKAGSAGAGGSGGTGGAPSCNATNTCNGAVSIGTMPGDSGGNVLTYSGTTGMWLKLRASESDSSPLAASMRVDLALTVPSGLNFDLYAYLNKDSDVLECNALADFSLNQGNAKETFSLEWGETGTFANSSDDDRWVTVEVRYVTGTCSSTAKWTLTASN